jgi:hypothetical protein
VSPHCRAWKPRLSREYEIHGFFVETARRVVKCRSSVGILLRNGFHRKDCPDRNRGPFCFASAKTVTFAVISGDNPCPCGGQGLRRIVTARVDRG